MAILFGNKLPLFESSSVPDTEREGCTVLCASESRELHSGEVVYWKRIVTGLLNGE